MIADTSSHLTKRYLCIMESNMSSDDDDDDEEEEVVVVGTKKSPLKEVKEAANGGGSGWTIAEKTSLVTIVGEKGAHIPPKNKVQEKWKEVMSEVNIRMNKQYSRWRTLQDKYKDLVSESVGKDPDNDAKFTDAEAELWSKLEDQRQEIAKEAAKEKKAKDKKDSELRKLIREGKEERDVASKAMIDGVVTRLGGQSWVFDGDEVKAKKEDGTEFRITLDDIKDNKTGSGGRGGTVAQVMKELAERRMTVMLEEMKLKAQADQQRFELEMQQRKEEMKQRDHQHEASMRAAETQRLMLLTQLARGGGIDPAVLAAFGGGTTAGANEEEPPHKKARNTK